MSVLETAAAYVEQMAADHEAAAVHLLASPWRVPVALDEARIRDNVAANLRDLATWLRQIEDPTNETGAA